MNQPKVTANSTQEYCRQLMRRLSARERQVLGLMVAVLSTKEISDKLRISGATVGGYRLRVYIKLNVEGLAGAVRVAVLGGI